MIIVSVNWKSVLSGMCLWYVLLFCCSVPILFAQPVPSVEENIPFLMTFGPEADSTWGDDDFTQVFFFVIPQEYKKPVFFRVFDPDIGGRHDEINNFFTTEMEYAIYGGKGAYSHEDAQNVDPVGNFDAGNLLGRRVFDDDATYDNDWYSFGPFNPTEGEFIDKFNACIFKIIVRGLQGDDGNLYRFFISSSNRSNVPIDGANAFTYEYSFRMHDDPAEVSHIYPYIDDQTVSIRQANFDWDADGYIRIVSRVRKGELLTVSGDGNWIESEFKIYEEEKNASIDFQFIKNRDKPVTNNNVVINIRNQYGEMLPFYTVPIGGVPSYNYKINVIRK